MFESVRPAALAALVTATLCTGAAAQDETAGPKIDPKAEELVKKLTQHYSELETVSCTIDLDMTMTIGADKQEMNMLTEFAAERPNRFASRLKEGMMGVTIVSDGENLYTYVPMMQRYTKEEAPSDFTKLAERTAMAAGMSGAGESQLILGLLAEEGYDNLMEGVSEITYVGEETVDEKNLSHIRLMREEVDLDVWVAASDEPWIVRIVPDVQKAMKKMSAENEGSPFSDMQVEVNVAFDDWSTDEPSEGTFAFEAPADAEQVEDLFAQPEMAAGPNGPEASAEELVDQPAPDFSLPRLESAEEVQLSDHKGKDIVVLDFWGTWCPPCVKALPTIAEVTKQFEDRHVVFYAVDLGDTDEKVKAFLEKRNLSINVLMDREGKVADLYRAVSVPQTVIISKDGVVEAVHIGLLPNLKEQLTSELEKLVADGKL